MTVLELLEELEDIVDTASSVPLTGKIMVDGNEILEIVNDIRNTLPEDVKQAHWLKGEQNRILEDAKKEYQKLVVEAKKQADFLVDNNAITLKARKHADQIEKEAEEYAAMLKLRTYDYLDQMLFKMQKRMDDLNNTYFGSMYDNLAKTFEGIDSQLANNRDELKQLASRTQHGEDWLYEKKPQNNSSGGNK